MKIIPAWFKRILKKSDLIVDAHRRILWQFYLLKDWWGTKVWKKTHEVVTPLGFRLNSGFHPAYQMMREGTFEINETELLQRIFQRIDIFVDVGANLGYYTCLGLMNGKYVIAVGPQPQNLRCLYQNIHANGWHDGYEIFPLALSKAPGILTLFGASGPSASLVSDWAGYSSIYKQTVSISTLDILVGSRFSQNQLLIKIDVEGAEFAVLSGAIGLVEKKIKPIWLVEICSNEFHPDGFNPDFRGVFELFINSGYLCHAVTRNLQPVSLSDVDRWIMSGVCESQTTNYLFSGETFNLN